MVNDLFRVHRLNAAGVEAAEKLAAAFTDCLAVVELLLVPTAGAARELAIVRTKLQEASFFAKRGIASMPVNIDPEPWPQPYAPPVAELVGNVKDLVAGVSAAEDAGTLGGVK